MQRGGGDRQEGEPHIVPHSDGKKPNAGKIGPCPWERHTYKPAPACRWSRRGPVGNVLLSWPASLGGSGGDRPLTRKPRQGETAQDVHRGLPACFPGSSLTPLPHGAALTLPASSVPGTLFTRVSGLSSDNQMEYVKLGLSPNIWNPGPPQHTAFPPFYTFSRGICSIRLTE